jgi:hypothetical protein
MRTIVRRLQRIEARLTPMADLLSQRAAQLLWERRRSPHPGNGEPFNEPTLHTGTAPPGGYLSPAETLLHCPQLNERVRRPTEIEGDIDT